MWLTIIVLALWLVLFLVFMSLSLVLIIGAPYVPTISASRAQALELLNLKPNQTLVDLGSGDGAMLIAAAEAGLNAVGYELNPFLVLISRARARRYKGRVQVVWGSFWRADLTRADGVFVFLLDRFMPKLDRKLAKSAKNHQLKLVSHAFTIPGKKPTRKLGAMRLYIYPS